MVPMEATSTLTVGLESISSHKLMSVASVGSLGHAPPSLSSSRLMELSPVFGCRSIHLLPSYTEQNISDDIEGIHHSDSGSLSTMARSLS